MNRQIFGAQPWLRSLMLVVLLVGGCARVPGDAVVGPVESHEDGRAAVLEARPSPTAAALLPADARLRMALGPDGTVALVIIGPDRRIVGHMRIAPGTGPRERPGVRIEWEEHGGRTAQVEAWSSAGGLQGHAFVGERAAAWRVRYDADGSLAGEGWSAPRRGSARAGELAELERARVLAAELGELVTLLSNSGVLDERRSCALAEQVLFAELALDLGARAWTGHGRAHLPTVAANEDPCRL